MRPEPRGREAYARRSLSLALLLTAVVGVVLTLGLLEFDQRGRQGQEREALAQQAARANELAFGLDAQLRIAEQLLNSLAALVAPLHERGEVEALLQRLFSSAPKQAVYGMGVWFEPGQIGPGERFFGPYIHQSQSVSGGTPDLTYEWSTPSYNYPEHSWYQEARILGGRIAISDPYFDMDQTYESLTRAFYDERGRMRGVVSVDVVLPQVREEVRRANVSPVETFYVTSPRGVLVAHPQEDEILAWYHERGRPVLSLSELKLEDLRRWEQAHGLDQGRRLSEVIVPSSGWRVFASTTESTLFATARHHRWLVAALCLVLWTGLGTSAMAMARSERARALVRTLDERQRREEERKRLLAQVRQRSAELQAILDNMLDAVTVIDAGGTVVLSNRAAQALLGQPSYEGGNLETSFRLHAPRELDGRALTFDVLPLSRALRGEQVSDTDLLISQPHQNGRKVVLRLNASPIRDESGRVVAAVAVSRDITQAIELERLQGEFVAMAAHELKTPLAVTKSFAQLARRTEHHSLALCRLLEGICRGTDRMDRVVRTLLDASQLQLGRMRFDREEVELRALVESVAGSTAAHHPHNPVHVRPGPRARVLGDRTRLEQVLVELLDNAARYSPADRPVEVELQVEADEVELSVHDEGIGIPAERQGQIFERFYRAHAGTPYDRGGMGLGLYLSRGIVLHHAGRVELESREGKGTTVRVRLPRLSEQQTAPEVATHEPPPGEEPTVHVS